MKMSNGQWGLNPNFRAVPPHTPLQIAQLVQWWVSGRGQR